MNSDNRKLIGQMIFLGLLVTGLVVLVWSMLSVKHKASFRNVTFLVEASGGYSIITLEAGSVKISKPATVTTPWRKVVSVASGEEVYLTASNPTQTGLLTCKILMDNVPGQEGSTNAPKDGVACAGIVP